MRQLKNLVALYRPIAGLPVDRQREACHALAKQLGVKVAMEYNAADDPDALTEWRKCLSSRDVAVVAKLICIPDWRAKGRRPASVLGETLADLSAREVMLIAASDNVSSAEGPKWVAAARAAYDAISSGNRKLPRKKAQEMARRSHERRADGPVRRWTSEAMTDVRERWAVVWRDTKYSRADDAFASMPEDVQRDIGSVQSARRIFGKRRPGDKGAGGRPTRAQTAARRKPTNVVYFIQYGKTKRVKIGTAENVAKRLSGIRTSSPGDYKLLATVPGDYVVEAEMHRRFRKYWIKREWFSLEGSLAKFVNSLREKQQK